MIGPIPSRIRYVFSLAAFTLAIPATAEELSFNRDVRPILSEHCFQCHGADEHDRQGGLRLDRREGAVKGGESGEPAIVAGKPDASELVRRIESSDADLLMPPPKAKKELTAAQKQILRRWVTEGAAYQVHWSFTPVNRPAVPEEAKPEISNLKFQIRNPIDAFVLARLRRESLKPSPAADKLTLLRRLSLDLTGLPPTIAEAAAFLADTRPDAYEQQIERLLMSPHYGERWGRMWLDGARYADSDGYEKDKPRFVWAYRDWVVNAFNRDLPYNQFIIAQIAGDLLPNPTQDQLVATGFLRNSMINEEGGVDPEQFRMEAMFDRMDAIGKSILGLTIQCSQCHSHKYDPLSMDDYYRMFAFLNDTHEANVAVYPPDELRQRADLLRQIAEIEDDMRHKHPDWPQRMAAWETSVRGDQPTWTVVKPELDASGGQKHYVLADGSILAAGYAPTKHETSFTVQTDVADVRAVRVEMLNDPNLPLGGPGRSIKGTFALTEFKLEAGSVDGSTKLAEVKLVSATADVNPPERELAPLYGDKTNRKRITGPIDFALDRKDETAWTNDLDPGRRNVPRNAVFVLEKPVSFPGGTQLKFRLVQNHGGWNSDDNQNLNLGRFRLSVTAAENAKADTVPVAVRKIFSLAPEKRTEAQTRTVFSHWRTTVTDWQAENDKIEALWRQHPEGTSQLAMQARDEPRGTFVLARGDFLKPTKPVTGGVPSFLHEMKAKNPTRLDFARWLADSQSPTVARSIVNRVWQAYFGTGLTATSDDLGLQGEPPSHPELLDWLAAKFMEDGWSLKSLHRLIANSATYRQSSDRRATNDPDNRLLARGPRFRMEAEAVRDIALAASGLLNPKIGGPPVFPPAPDFLFQPPASYGPKTWNEDRSPDRYRRAIYTFRFRSVPYPVLQNFDAPNGDTSCVRRVRSNTPLQALTTLNEPLFLECARSLALRTVQDGGATDRDRLTYAFRRCVTRSPDEMEQKTLLELLVKQQTRFAAADAKPWDLAANDSANPPSLPAGVTPAQLAAWTSVARVLLNLDETITKP